MKRRLPARAKIALDQFFGAQRMTKFLAGAITLIATLLMASPVRAAEPMTSKALILIPFVLTKLSDLSFGTIIPTGRAEFVEINPEDGSRTMSDEAMRVASDEGNRAEFASSGSNNNLVLIRMVGPRNLVNAAGNLLKVNRLELDQDNKTVRQLSPTSQIFFVGVGGEIYIRPDQEEGVYTGTFTLTATYL